MDNDFNAIGLFFTGLISIFTLLINMICLLLVLKYYKGLTMLKRLTEEVVIPIPYRSVSNRLLSIPKCCIKANVQSIFYLMILSLLPGAIPFPQREYVCWNWWIQASSIGIKPELCRLIRLQAIVKLALIYCLYSKSMHKACK